MDEAEFLSLMQQIVDNKQYVLGFIFDNVCRMFFGNEFPNKMFTLSSHYDAQSKCIIDTTSVDSKYGTTYVCYKPISTIQSVLVTAPGKTLENYDPRWYQ